MNTDFSGSDIQKGMDVYDSTGQKIGSISDVYQNSGFSGTGGSGFSGNDPAVGDVVVEEVDVVTTSDYGNSGSDIGSGTGTGTGTFSSGSDVGSGGGYGTGTSDTGTSTSYGTSSAGIGTMTSTGYFKVGEGGVLGIGATDLYIPFSAVSSVTAEGVNLNCTKDQAEGQYRQKPAFIDNSTNS